MIIGICRVEEDLLKPEADMKFMRVGGEKCVSVEIERRRGDGGKNGGRRVEREREKGVLRNLTLGCGA